MSKKSLHSTAIRHSKNSFINNNKLIAKPLKTLQPVKYWLFLMHQ